MAMIYPSSFPNGRKGSSLVIVLTLLAMLTLVIVAAMAMVSFEIHQSASVLESQRAENVAKIAMDEVAEKLSSIPLDKHWAAAPGLIRYWNGSNWNNTIELHSGNTSTANEQTDLNVKLADGSYAILPENAEYPTAPKMKLDWIYILEDGTLIKGPLTPTQVPLGRFAYWTDLENARVNLNTAGFGMTKLNYHLQNTPANTITANYSNLVFDSNPWMTDRVDLTDTGPVFSALDRTLAQTKTPQNLVGHPSSLDLSFLEDISEEQSFNTFRYAGSYFLRVDAKNTYTLSGSGYTPAVEPDIGVRFFNTPGDWRMIVGEEAFQKNKGYITTLGRSPEITPWGTTKIPLTMVSKEGYAINELTETFQRTKSAVPNGDHAAYTQDTRRVQVPALLPVSIIDGQRSLFRDLTSSPSPNNGTDNHLAINDLGKDLSNFFTGIFPGYASSLASKYNAISSGETDQIAVELMRFLDSCLGGSPAAASFLPSAKPGSFALSAPMVKGTTVRRTGSEGPLLINELVLQAAPVRYTELVPYDPPYTLFNVDGLKSNAFSPVLMPKAVRTTQSGQDNSVYLYLTRDYAPTDYFIKVILKGELMTAANNGLLTTASAGKALTSQWDLYATNNECTWTSDDPLSGSGTLIYDYRADTAQGIHYRRLNFTTLNATSPFPSRPASGNAYMQTPTTSNGRCFLVGPFAAGTVVSSLKFRLRIMAQNSGWEGPLWQSYPGIFEDFVSPTAPPAADTSSTPDALATFLEFEFTDIDIASPLPHYASLELNDPRVSRRKSDWKPVGGNSHSLAAENTIYTGSSAPSDGSDLSHPDILLQAIRGPLRRASPVPPAGSRQSETQNASRILGLPGVGYLSSVPTGVDSGLPWKTLRFHKNTDNPPDWLLWNLFYVPFDRSMLSQTDGKLNLNTTLYPFGIKRTKPLETLIANRVASPSTLVNSIANGPNTTGLPNDLYVYPGQICDVPGLADTGTNEYAKEALPRDLADLVTTQCSDFRVFIVAQALKKTPNGTLLPTATHRAEVTLSRTVDVGAQTYSFGEMDGIPLPEIYRRSAYASQGIDAPRIKLDTIKNSERSPLGPDRIPNTADDWLNPQKIDVTSYRTIR